MRSKNKTIVNTKAVLLSNIKGSSAVMLAIVFVAFAICITGAVTVCRRLVVSSECETFGRLWTKAVLSEYDVHLLDDYSIMAYFGNDSDVTEKINSYIDYSAKGKLDEDIRGANADLTGYELGDLSNFRKALRLGFTISAASELISGRGRTYRGPDSSEGKSEAVINNQVVLDTLPSAGAGGSVDTDSLIDKAKEAGNEEGLNSLIQGTGAEMLILQKCFDNHVTKADDKKHLLTNEWEYIVRGSNDDETNYDSCRIKLFAVRNALNLLALYKDPEKTEAIISAAEAITPGPAGLLTQLLLAEAWAAIETEEDLKSLYEDGRVPVIKSPEQWKTGLGAVLDSDDVKKKLDDESKEMMDENMDELREISGSISTAAQIKDGLNYDEYLLLMIMSVRGNTRMLRIMDLITINMKYRYYRDFNMMEYYIGTRFTIDENGKSHVFEDTYR